MESMNVKESSKKYLGDEDRENVCERPASELQSRPGPSRIGHDNGDGENVYERPPRLASELQSSDTQGSSRIGCETRSDDSHIGNPFLSNRPRRYRPYDYEDLMIPIRLRQQTSGMPMTGEIEASDDVIVIDDIQDEEAGTSTSRPNVEEPPGDSVPKKNSVKLPRKHGNDDKEPTEKELNQDLLHLLECPVCMECMEPPLGQCRRGHLVCDSCRLKLNVCPICRTTFSSTRNRAMEGVAELVLYPCRHECGKRMRLRRRLSHEVSCEARRYSCPISKCSLLQPPVPREELVQHIKSTHNARIKIGEEQRLLITTACCENEWMLFAHHELFQLCTRIEKGHFDLYVAYIGPKCNSTRYIYKVKVQDKSKARQVTYSRYTHSDQESCQQTLARQDCFHLSVEQVVNMQRDRDGEGSAPGMLDLRLRLIDTSSRDKTKS